MKHELKYKKPHKIKGKITDKKTDFFKANLKKSVSGS